MRGGFPSEGEIATMFGVTPQDREKWAKQREMTTPEPGTVSTVAHSSMQAGKKLAQMGIQSQMTGQQVAAAELDQQSGYKKRRTVEETVDFEPIDRRTHISDLRQKKDDGPSFG